MDRLSIQIHTLAGASCDMTLQAKLDTVGHF